MAINKIYKNFRDIKPYINRTELRRLDWLKRFLDSDIYGKFENQQIGGSFKYRGACTNSLEYNKYNRDKPLVVASAGGHGLAMAVAAENFNIPTIIVVPQTGSNLKKSRIATCKNVTLIKEGDSLELSTKYAKTLAKKLDTEFISPYNHKNIVLGQSSLALELLEQLDSFDTLIVPLGGGGLISGVGRVIKEINPNIKIIGVQAKNYASAYKSIANDVITRVPNSPTFADGLAVNLEENSITFRMIKEYVDEIVLVDEEEIAAGVSTILNHESQLLEGAGAVGISALISGKIDAKKIGKAVVIFTGGNVTRGTLMQMLNYPIRNKKLLNYSGLIGYKPTQEVEFKGLDNRKIEQKQIITKNREFEEDIKNDVEIYQGKFKYLKEVVDEIDQKMSDYKAYCSEHSLSIKSSDLDLYNNFYKIINNNISSANNIIAELKKLENVSENKISINSLYRTTLQLLPNLGYNNEWRSASYDQSILPNFFDMSTQDNPGVNYNRYESYILQHLEKNMSEILNIDNTKHSLLLMSSGMAAYTTIESYLMRHKLKEGDKIYIPTYIYFEIEEQISSLNDYYKIIKEDTYDEDEIIKSIKQHEPKVVLLDPLTNTEELRVINIPYILKELDKVNSDTNIVIDGTMLSGTFRPENILKQNTKLSVYFHESCSKYLQLGQDIAMAGLVITSNKECNEFIRLRRNLGSILYDNSVLKFPTYDRKILLKRMHRLSSNAEVVCNLINNNESLSGEIKCNYPTSSGHQDIKKVDAYKYFGGIVTFSFAKEMNRDALNSIIEYVLSEARERNYIITKGVSFGFVSPRISAASSMAEGSPPFLRLFCGEGDIQDVHMLSNVIQSAFEKFLLKEE